MRLFARGAVCGDVTWSAIGCADNGEIPRLAGYILGSFIPLVDIRDVVAGIIKLDAVGALFSLAGLVPLVGDAGSVAGKIGKFVGKFPAKRLAALTWVARSDNFSPAVKRTVLRLSLREWGTLRGAGLAEDEIVNLARGYTHIPDLAEAFGRALRAAPEGSPIGWVKRSGATRAWQAAENRVGEIYTRLNPGYVPKKGRMTVDGEAKARIHDLALPDGSRVEVKSGFTDRFNRSSDLCDQMRLDRLGVDSGEIPSIKWHFVGATSTRPGSDFTYGLGPSKAVLDCLTQYAIPFVIHLPS